ncbi:hypothetical protein IGB42_01301 [Andreprevotia sp. IGB-42]|uniref:hypothetical protein n=1 Tax=Andreprevotia sp. IGB-42 TaxID=2497473 RepID=UPI00135CCD25|nr:hypothetical protein [Andreprevotia sp. IGB-42]KAF0814400.1 hypothetical protein IGB42_01301 [Andreprevotia sp. IGB-42]
MDRFSGSLTHRCGHALAELAADFDTHEAYLIRAAFRCPGCIADITRRLGLNTRVYVNLQQLSPGMAAFVAEVSETGDELDDLLAAVGYGRRGKSGDELHPGVEISDPDQGSVWRKEFWFSTNADPRHVVALIDHIKLEMSWLSAYLPEGKDGIEFCAFPE